VTQPQANSKPSPPGPYFLFAARYSESTLSCAIVPLTESQFELWYVRRQNIGPLRDPSPEELLSQLDVAPLHALAANVGVDVGLLAEQGKARLLDVVEKVGRLHPEIDGEVVRFDQQLPNVDRVADPVLVKENGTTGEVKT
jgi:hypothetical protein